jgi:dipeptidyl aminopeptidase/acylaminoacyl peptidase
VRVDAVIVGGLVGLTTIAACGARTGLDAPAPAGIPTIDAGAHPGPGLSDCPDAGATLVYVVTGQGSLYSFYPPTAAFTNLGALACPTPGPQWGPFSMAVDHEGTAYVLFDDQTNSDPFGQLYQVDPATMACTSLPFAGGQHGFDTFGMGFVGDADGTSDTLYVASDGSSQLGILDLATFLIHDVKSISPGTVQSAELSGTGDGRLFAFYAIDQGSSSAVGELDPATGALIANDDLTDLPQVGQGGGGWAFGFWGGQFYLFTTNPSDPSLSSIVTRFDPGDGSQVDVASLPETIVGAGVSTCAPQ